jgi:RNA polymerase subunit RPABC4/transcription elongation factor Spt4
MPTCSHCDNDVSWEAAVCPRCGQPEPWRQSGHWYADVDSIEPETSSKSVDALDEFIDSFDGDEVAAIIRSSADWKSFEPTLSEIMAFLERRPAAQKANALRVLFKLVFVLGRKSRH